MITPEKRRKLEEHLNTMRLIDEGCDIFWEAIATFARIQSEESESDEEFSEKMASEVILAKRREGKAFREISDKDFVLAGCARYRPIVEEMLLALHEAEDTMRELAKGGSSITITLNFTKSSDLIARAEAMLGEKK